jgi:bifunctional oligoribonuclease and PAP phosphatase NrnA
MTFRDDGLDAVAALVAGLDRVVLTGHSPLDGDGLGSALGLCRSLRLKGRRARVVSDAPVPKGLRWLPGADDVLAWTKGAYDTDPTLSDPQALLCFDSGDVKRLGGPYDELPKSAVVVNVDHHVTNTGYGHVNWVDAEAPSVGEMVFRLLKKTGLPVDRDVAMPLYLSLVEDTGRFSYSNTSPAALRAAAEMVEAGADPETLTNHMFRNEDLATMRLRARCVERLETAAGGRLATTFVTRRDLDELGLLEGDQGREMVEVAIGLEGAEVGILFRGLGADEGVKLSFRSKTDFDVAAICVARGGGGHKKASGCTVPDDDLPRVRKAIVAEVAASIEAHGRRERTAGAAR